MSYKNNQISIIVPTLNEEDNIKPLVERIDHIMEENKIEYEILFIDDHSPDKTQKIITSLAEKYPINLHIKVGTKGKAQSLIEGFTYAKYDVICMIDGDLQYPPESIPVMMKKLEDNMGVVVANRKDKQVSLKRKVIGNIYKFIFAKVLHNFNCDVQSGLKVFNKEIIERMSLNPSDWTFDLEFLINARNAGYPIYSQDIIFSRRYSGKPKINLISASLQIGLTAMKLKLLRSPIINFHPNTELKKGKGFHYNGEEFIHHSHLPANQTAVYRFSGIQILLLIALALITSISLFVNWHFSIVVVVAVLTTLYFLDLLFNLFLIYRSFSKTPELLVSDEEINKVKEPEWPMYTILCPLYKEWKVIPQFVTSINNIDYPKNKLQVILLLEEDDKESIENIKKFTLPSFFEILIVPHSKPKTKPKACNYALPFAKGEYTVIYDAEDVPDRKQLKKAILGFKKADNRTICIQAKLNFYNPHQNILTRVFTAEYSLWFDLILTGLQSIHAPIPLGGTSNHFRTKDLFKLKGWDSFNVTEDCDLGMRLVKAGYRTAVIQSITLEEANSDLKNWFWQRTRWIKGYMQTYILHMRKPSEFLRTWKEPHFVTFQLVVGGKILSIIINPLMWVITISYFLFRAQIGTFIESFFPAPVLYMGLTSLLLGNFLYAYYYMVGCVKHGHDELVKYLFLVPFYWLAMSVAAWVAFYKLLTAPHHWSKTKHGLHLDNKKSYAHAEKTLNKPLVDTTLTHTSF